MNKERINQIIGILVILLICLAFFLFGFETPNVFEGIEEVEEEIFSVVIFFFTILLIVIVGLIFLYTSRIKNRKK